ncbi:MAG: hypothetical protein M3R65_09695 [Gemmatimonadota bacterium]|nr:hypothetical protein [Gemmatimonadota bacterium]
MRPRLSLTVPHVVLSLLIVTGCASGTAVTRSEDPVLVMITNNTSLRYNKDIHVATATVPGTPSSLSAKLYAAYTSLGLAVTARDTTNFTIAAQNNQLSGKFNGQPASRIVDCGATPYGAQRADAYKVWLTVATQLQPDPAGTQVRTIVVANAQDQTSSTAPVQCGSSGVIEGAIARQLGANQ